LLQVITPSTGQAFLKLRLKDQAAALQLLDSDPALKDLNHVRAPLVDVEVRQTEPGFLMAGFLDGRVS
jgi:hypothetical protein